MRTTWIVLMTGLTLYLNVSQSTRVSSVNYSDNGRFVTVMFPETSNLGSRLVCPDTSLNPRIKKAWFGISQDTKVKDCRSVTEEQTKTWLDRTIEVSLGCVGDACNLPPGSTIQSNYWLICFECISDSKDPGSKMDSNTPFTSTSQTPIDLASIPSSKVESHVDSHQDIALIFNNFVTAFDISRISTDLRHRAETFGLDLLRHLIRRKISDNSSSARAADAILQIMDLILGRMTLLLNLDTNATYVFDNPVNMTIILIHTSFKEDSSISIGDINIPHQVSIVADNTTKSIRAAYVDLKSDQLGRALGLSQPHLDIKTFTVFSDFGDKMSEVMLSDGQEIVVSFHQEYNTNPSCVFWDGLISAWSVEGCRLSSSNVSVQCVCQHLTNFALLVSLRHTSDAIMAKENEMHQGTLRIITLCGCSFSAVALLASLIFFMQQSSTNDRIKINSHFCLNLFIAELLILTGYIREIATNLPTLCYLIAIFLHLSLLSAFFWSLIAGFKIYLLLIVIFNSEHSSMSRYTLFGYGLPLLGVFLAVLMDLFFMKGETYRSHELLPCWMDPNILFITFFIVPITTIIIINVCSLTIALVRVCHLSPRPLLFQQARCLLSLLFILGGTWILGLMNNLSPNIYLTYSFVILNSFQGVFIFIFYVLLCEKFLETTQEICRSKSQTRETGTTLM